MEESKKVREPTKDELLGELRRQVKVAQKYYRLWEQEREKVERMKKRKRVK